jgi:propionate CoA-transferase
MGLRDDMLSIPFEQRFTYDETTNHFFVNLERFAVCNEADIEHIRQIVTDRVAPLGKSVYAIVNYDNFTIDPALLDEYSAMVRGLMDKYYAGHALHDLWFPPHEARRRARKTRCRPAYL